MRNTLHWIMTIIDETIEQCLPNDCLMNWIEPKFKARNKNQVSNYRTIMVSSTIAILYSTINAWTKSQNK